MNTIAVSIPVSIYHPSLKPGGLLVLLWITMLEDALVGVVDGGGQKEQTAGC